MKIVSLVRYPVKGLSPEPMPFFDLDRGAYVPGDRLFAVENGPAGFDPANPSHQPKVKFLMLMRHEALARLRTRYDDADGTLRIDAPDGRQMVADLSRPEGRETVSAFMRDTMASVLKGEPAVLTAPPGFRFTDSRQGYVSLVNLASVAAIAEWVGVPVDPLRFRGNLMVEGLSPFAELDLVGARLVGPSGLTLTVTKRTVRCAAVNVDPVGGARDLDIPATLMRRLGHMDCGVYVAITRGGRIAQDDTLAIETA